MFFQDSVISFVGPMMALAARLNLVFCGARPSICLVYMFISPAWRASFPGMFFSRALRGPTDPGNFFFAAPRGPTDPDNFFIAAPRGPTDPGNFFFAVPRGPTELSKFSSSFRRPQKPWFSNNSEQLLINCGNEPV